MRDPYDYYPTPGWPTKRLIESPYWKGTPQSRLLEPCAGDGAIIRQIKGANWTAVEIQSRFRESLIHSGARRVYTLDFLSFPVEEMFDIAISNPPYLLAEEIVKKALEHAKDVYMLLRINFKASEKRHNWLSQWMPNDYVLPNRPSFTSFTSDTNSTDQTEYAWFHWSHDRKGPIGQTAMLALTPMRVRT